jgi:hypothetical protein
MASRVIDRISAKSASFRIPRSRLWDGKNLSPDNGTTTTARTVSKDSVSANVGIKSWLVHGFRILFIQRPWNDISPPVRSDGAGIDVAVEKAGGTAAWRGSRNGRCRSDGRGQPARGRAGEKKARILPAARARGNCGEREKWSPVASLCFGQRQR